MPKFSALFFLALASLSLIATAPSPAPQEVRYGFLFSGNRAGEAVSRVEANGERVYTFEFNDRGRGPKTSTRVRLDDKGLPTFVEITGNDYWKVPVEERFEWKEGRAVWKNGSEKEDRELRQPAFYLSLNGPPQETELLARALLAAGGRLPVLPTGEAVIEKVSSLEVKGTGGSRKVDLYAISGLGFTPGYVWLDAERNLFASVGGWAALFLEGWESAVPELTKVQDAAVAARQKDLAAKLARRPAGSLTIRHARLFDPETGAVRPESTVVVSGHRIQAVGPDGEVQVPPEGEVVDAKGKMLLPGLWDMHTHLGEDQGLMHLAAGVTTVRDLANDTDKLLDMRRRWDAGEALGPRVLMAGFMDGPGPFAGPTKVLVDTEEEALAAVDNYARLGFVQIKLYSSLDPKLVPAIVQRAHRHGMRVSGHIPNGMTAEQAVRAGFDEIQHVNFLILNFLPPEIDTRTPARFTEVAKHASELDLNSERVRNFIGLLKERGTVSDPTLVAFEGMFTGRADQLDPSLAMVADRFPAQVRRSLYGGGLNPPADLVQRYRDSYRAMQNMVRALHDAGVTIVAGTDAMPGFSLHRELELYVDSGIPAPEVLRIATLGAARVMKRDGELGTLAPGKLADMILVDGDPTKNISDIRRVALTIKDGTVYDPAALYGAIGVKPAL
ncbi:MAG TPA: amidohydrolase family protein [Thermoanaerobaculia bacterium]|jgi:imidazolonepropionase-like amidohydrolase|nr:amidohydrolase family protein [Thermoanaerobaculia bacterium]